MLCVFQHLTHTFFTSPPTDSHRGLVSSSASQLVLISSVAVAVKTTLISLSRCFFNSSVLDVFTEKKIQF